MPLPYGPLVKVLILNGLRRTEAASLEWSFIDEVEGVVSIPAPQLEGVAPYTLKDLRTFATMHAKIGTPIHITEKLLNQVSGTISGFAAIYNRHTYLEEMQTALDAYDENLAAKHWLSPSESRSMCFKYKWQKNADKTYDFMF